jgi:hypothetical protein
LFCPDALLVSLMRLATGVLEADRRVEVLTVHVINGTTALMSGCNVRQARAEARMVGDLATPAAFLGTQLRRVSRRVPKIVSADLSRALVI